LKLLIDNALSPRLADELRAHGVDAVHVRDLGLATESDATILKRAATDGRILVSRDGDFAALLANGGLTLPSFVHLRAPRLNRLADQIEVLLRTLEAAAEDLARGAIVTVRGAQGERVRVRGLPVR
jgi:predicted nuclease of predicted toxin-antitoxin system